MGRVFNRGKDVFAFEEIVIGENLVESRAFGQKLEHVGNANALAPDARTAPALAFFNGDSFESVGAHGLTSRYARNGTVASFPWTAARLFSATCIQPLSLIAGHRFSAIVNTNR